MQASQSPARNLIIGVLLLVLGGFVGFRYGQMTPSSGEAGPKINFTLTNTPPPVEYRDVDFSVFWEVWKLLERDYLHPEKIQTDKMVNGAISGMTASLEDPYTMYLPPVQNQRRGEDLAGAFYGVGIELGYIDNMLAVMSPLPDNPAEKAGVKAKDLILRVKDESKNVDEATTGWTLDEAIEKIRGQKGTKVTLTLHRPDEQSEPFEITMERAEIVVPTVELKYVESNGKKVAHLKLSQFGERTNSEWDKAVIDILAHQQEIAGVVLDVRNNPGGFFDGAITIASEFIAKGVIVSQAGKTEKEDFQARGQARLMNIPVEVIVNKGSASSSEIVAGALKDQRGARLIGEKTFGKGTVQDRVELSNGGGVHITVARFLLPKGESIQDTGIPVDVEVTDNEETPEDEVLLKAIEVL